MRRALVLVVAAGVVLGLTAMPGAAASDQATTKKIVLVKRDGPKGWKATPSDQEESNPGADEVLAQCVGIANPTPQRTARWEGPEFEKGSSEFSTSAVAYETKQAIKQAMAIYSSPQSGQCLEQAFTDQLAPRLAEDDVTLSDVQIQPLEVPKVGDQRVGMLVTATLTSGDESRDLFIVTVLVRKGRFGVDFTAQTFDKVFSQKLGYQLLRRLDSNLDDAT
jgi:hypothetical protein